MIYGIERKDGKVVTLKSWSGRKVPAKAWEWQGDEREGTTEGRHLYMTPKGFRIGRPDSRSAMDAMAQSIESVCRADGADDDLPR